MQQSEIQYGCSFLFVIFFKIHRIACTSSTFQIC
uniref:Uncharacterized protein n=1 Tax=Arundo donax TaxID=35708 RepID=A0A0A9AFA2_ARUDO